MNPELRNISSKKLIGKRVQTSVSSDKTFELWKSFMPDKDKIANKVPSSLYSVQVFNAEGLKSFNENTFFEKWAAVEVTEFDSVPAGMETIILPPGLYAVFVHKGTAQNFDYIYKDWLPASNYYLDNRPHVAVMGEKYRNNDPASEEEIWVPVKSKTVIKI